MLGLTSELESSCLPGQLRYIIHFLHAFDSDAVDLPLRPIANRFGGCFCLGSGPVFWVLLCFLLFASLFPLAKRKSGWGICGSSFWLLWFFLLCCWLVYLFTLFCKDLLCSCFHFGSRTFICMFNIFVFGHTRPFPVCVVAVAVLFNNISASTFVFGRVEGVGIDSHFIFYCIS